MERISGITRVTATHTHTPPPPPHTHTDTHRHTHTHTHTNIQIRKYTNNKTLALAVKFALLFQFHLVQSFAGSKDTKFACINFRKILRLDKDQKLILEFRKNLLSQFSYSIIHIQIIIHKHFENII